MSTCTDSSHTSYCPDCCPDAFMCPSCELTDGRDYPRELAELVRVAQHHIPRNWPQSGEWLDRALAVLGDQHARSGTGVLAKVSELQSAPSPASSGSLDARVDGLEARIGALGRECAAVIADARMLLADVAPRGGLMAWAKDTECGGTHHLRAWATHAAPMLTADGWARLRLAFGGVPTELHEVVIAKNGALLAYRDMIIAALKPEQRSGLLGKTDLGAAPGFEWMRSAGIVGEHCERTAFGDELARMIELDEDRVTPCQN